MNLMVEGFLLGTIATSALTVALFFFVYWRRSRDTLFLSFSIAFLMEGLNRISLLSSAHPNDANSWYYFVRLLAFLIILTGIMKKNYGRG
jgi:CDP-diglyceride synthetase